MKPELQSSWAGARPVAASAPVAATSLTRRLMIGLTMAVGLSSALVVALLTMTAMRMENSALQRDVDEAAAEAAQLLESPLWDLDMERASKIGEAFARDPRVATLTIHDASTGATRVIRRSTTSDTASRSGDVTRGGKYLGGVSVAFTRAPYRAHVWEEMRTAILVSLIALLATLFSVRMLLRRMLRRPLSELTDVVSSYTEGEYSKSSQAVPYGEFRPIFAVLNAMGDRITTQLRDLHDANSRLEREMDVRLDAEANALRSRNMLTQIMDTVPMTIFWKDLESVYLGCNTVFATIAGFSSPDDVIGKSEADLLPFHAAREYLADDREVIEHRRVKEHIIHRMVGADGRVRWMDTTKLPLMGHDGEVRGVLGVGRDITLDRERDEQLLHAQKLEAVGQLAGGVAHDFNNIMGAMVLELEMLELEQSLPPELAIGLRNVRASVDRAANLTRQLLLFGRRQAMHVQPHDLNVVVADLLRMLTRVIGENIAVEFVRSDVPVLVNADSGMLEQVLMNLCLNARDAMPSGGSLTITTAREILDDLAVGFRNGDHPEAYACLRVTDTGTGMSAETQRRMFEPFFTTKDVGKGSGLGLATTHGIVTQHHGWIDVTSEIDQGTTFSIYLPALATVPGNTPVSSVPVVKGGHEVILLVEDEKLLRTLISRTLRRLGYRVVEAANGADALSAWDRQRGNIDLVLTDMVMPRDVSGVELSNRLQERKPNLKAIVMSGYSVRLLEDEDVSNGSIRFLNKPFTIPALSDAVRAALDEGRREPAGTATA